MTKNNHADGRETKREGRKHSGSHGSNRPLVVVVASERSYVSSDIAIAATRLDIDLLFVTDRCHVLDELWPTDTIAVDMTSPQSAAVLVAETIRRVRASSVAAAMGTDEATAIVAEAIASKVGVACSRSGGAARAADKLATRETLTEAGLAQPRFQLHELGGAPPIVEFPVVVKPRCLSASRGVIRADTEEQLATALEQVKTVLADPDIRGRFGELADSVLIESYVPGIEVALDAVMIDGRLETVVLFDKPRPLEGPTFVESLYLVPTSLPPDRVRLLEQTCEQAAAALGLTDGPIHAEVRLDGDRMVVIEVAARSIGGLCGRTLGLAAGRSVADVVLARLCGLESSLPALMPAGVAMLAPPRAGIFQEMNGIALAEAIDGIDQIEITTRRGQRVVPLPAGSEYLGFVFASGASREAVVDALTRAEETLIADVRSAL